jgi:hypothetical protein
MFDIHIFQLLLNIESTYRKYPYIPTHATNMHYVEVLKGAADEGRLNDSKRRLFRRSCHNLKFAAANNFRTRRQQDLRREAHNHGGRLQHKTHVYLMTYV